MTVPTRGLRAALLLLAGRAFGQPTLEEFHAALLAQPDSPAAHNNLGLAFKAQGRLEVAVPLFQKAIELDPGYARGYNNLGNALQSMGDLEAAAEGAMAPWSPRASCATACGAARRTP